MAAEDPNIRPAAAAKGTPTVGRQSSTASAATIIASNHTSGMIVCSIWIW
jgi:hypothetical protein